ncbi:hypothetical protein DOTSEDRAFT_132374, partial [Dothistroma septosporum NZE10]
LFVNIVSGAFLTVIGLTDPSLGSTTSGLIAGVAIFLEAGDWANMTIVSHAHPTASGKVSGTFGAVGNLFSVVGNLFSVVFAIVFRYHHAEYATSFWTTRVMKLGDDFDSPWMKPLPKGQ